ncbi:RagB/SusD family nutrient uptake outer membrane protein [Sphingobacterium sp. SGL-16]|uniref:RagB/SusD family nutrient uptake outer membrane protein n=1 Tax=Sphingobacterium sp. SGL-16 TaxID=2710883 RepID=UPI00293BDBA5|nr:RagB/SusD family nutrient uptake outer membrane protein [Sphingobacterium sp. SGL-16]
MKSLLIFIVGLMFLFSCTPEFLSLKRDMKNVVPQSLEDFQSLMDYSAVMNLNSAYLLGEIGAGDFYLKDETWNALSSPWVKNAYNWQKDIFQGSQSDIWNRMYEKVLYCNIVLEGLARNKDDIYDIKGYNDVRGQALFWRSYSFYQLAQFFCAAYDKQNLEGIIGLPLRLESDIDQKVQQSTLQQTYNKIVENLLEAEELLKDDKPSVYGTYFKSRPSKIALRALLSRVYLQMQDYSGAKEYAQKVLSMQSELLDYNKVAVKPAKEYSFDFFGATNPEVLLYDVMFYNNVIAQSRLIVDSVLLRSYQEHDLRKERFFTSTNGGDTTFRGSYNGNVDLHGFITLPEVYLTLAESSVRTDDLIKAKDVMNVFLSKRYANGSARDISSLDKGTLLDFILQERRKELVFRGVRWQDLRRLNLEPQFERTITRNIEGTVYTLLPNSSKFIYPLPEDEVILNGYKQVQR